MTGAFVREGGKGGLCMDFVSDGNVLRQNREKLRAAKIFPWRLHFENGKGTMLTTDDVLTGIEGGTHFFPLDWDAFVSKMVHPEDQARVHAAMNRLRKDPGAFYQVEYRIWNPHDSTWSWIFAYGTVDDIAPDGTVLRVSGGVQDIRERVESKRLRELELQRNAAIIESLPGPYFLANTAGGVMHWNSQFVATFIAEGQDPALDHWTHIFVPEERPEVEAALDRAHEGGGHVFRAHATLRDGTQGFFLCQCRPFDEDGAKRVLVFLFDISISEAAAGEIQRQCAQLDAVVSAAELGTWDWNMQTGEVFYNKTWADIAGRDLEAIQGSVDAWTQAVLPEDLPKAIAAVEAHVRGENSMYEAEFRMYRGDGSVIWALDRGRVVEWDAGGKALRLVGVLQDINASKTAQMELTRSANQLELIIRETNFGTWDWNPVTNEIVFNETFFSLLGYGIEEIEPTFEIWSKLIHPDDLARAKEALVPLLEGKIVEYECEMRMRHRDGHYVWTYDKGRAIAWDDTGRVTRVVGGQLDIDKRKQQEQEQQEALLTIAMQKRVLERAVEERTALLHDTRRRVDDILAATGALPGEDATPAPGKENGGLLLPGEDTESFADKLGGAFDLITEKMWWYKGVIDSIPFPIFVMDMHMRWTYLNGSALENIGAPALGRVLGMPAKPWGEDTELGPEENGKGRRFSRYDAARRRYFQGQASFLLDQKGRSIGHIEVMQDVTRIHEADQRTRIMLDSMPQGCNFWDENLNLIDCNLASIALFGMPGKEEYLRRFYELSPSLQPDGRSSKELIRESMARAMREGYASFEWLHRKLDGTPIPAEITLVRVENANERMLVAYTRDLTELKRKEAELDKERQLLVKIMACSPVCFVILVEGVVRFTTPYAQDFFGIGVGGMMADLYADDRECSEFLRDVRRFGSINWRIVSMRSADGSVREMLANAFLAEYFDEPCVMSWFLDVTEMRETERQLRLARDEAEESTRAKGEFLANMSHEIRTPMNAILGMARLVLDTELTGHQRGYLEKAEQAAKALLRILNDILDFSKIEAGKLEMEKTDFQVAEVLQSVTEMFRESAAAKGLSLVLSLDMPEFPRVRGDPLRLHQILTNLIGNAIKFTKKGGVSVHAALEARTPEAASFSFRVRDTGIGLGREQLERLFSAFSQADASTTRRYGGTGLGLVISKRLVEMMQGEIRCTSDYGRGAEFSFTAVFANPVESAPAESGVENPHGMRIAAPSADNPRELVAHLKGKRLLVAEDNDVNQIVAREMLEKAGFAVEIAENGLEAIEMALTNRYDLIFMDIQMPETDGLSATVELRRHPSLRDVPIVAMTAHAMSGDKEKSLAVGMNDHVTKPIDPREVFSVIARWLPPQSAAAVPLDAGEVAFGRDVFKQPAMERTVTELSSSLPGIDVASGLTRVAGNKKLYVKLLRHIAAESPSTREKLTTAIMEGNTDAVREVAHSLKGASANLSATDVAAAAEKLEQAARAGDFSMLLIHLDALESALDAFVNVVNSLEDL